jgi:hypothetical protein
VKYEDTEFSDGTEPTVRRLPKGADQQGRYPEAAEAVTDIGQEDEDPEEDTMWFWIVCVVIITTILAAAAWKGMA